MDPELGEHLTRWTVRAAVACYVGWLGFALCRSERYGQPDGTDAVPRWLWTIGCGLFVLHVICAFHFHHHWSHAHAYAHTAEQTAALTGIHWGGGLWFNYLFAVAWLGDVARWWLRGVPLLRLDTTPGRFGHAFFAFMMFNATVVFGPPGWRVVALVLLPVAAGLWWRYRAGRPAT